YDVPRYTLVFSSYHSNFLYSLMRGVYNVGMDVINLGGVNYEKAAFAAKKVGYATDYVGQLCREGKVEAQRVGRSWYVRQGALQEHKKETPRANQREIVKEIERARVSETTTGVHAIHQTIATPSVASAYRKQILDVPIAYSSDEG